jgi:hypothetical protein
MWSLEFETQSEHSEHVNAELAFPSLTRGMNEYESRIEGPDLAWQDTSGESGIGALRWMDGMGWIPDIINMPS